MKHNPNPWKRVVGGGRGAVATAARTYLVDVLTLGSAAFDTGLRDLLESPAYIKVMHDCRKDSAALYHQHHVRPRPAPRFGATASRSPAASAGPHDEPALAGAAAKRV